MFQELMPLLAQRVLVLTLSRTVCDEICVNVLPRPLKPGEKDENGALSTPLSITGTPAELDQELPRQLVEFVGAHLQLSSSLESARELMAGAAKSARDLARRAAPSKAAIPSTADADRGTSSNGPSAAPSDEAEPTGASLVAPVATTQSLFEASPQEER